MSVNEVQPEKVPLPVDVMELGRVMLVNDAQSEKV